MWNCLDDKESPGKAEKLENDRTVTEKEEVRNGDREF